MTSEITRTEIGPVAFERGNGKFIAILPNGEAKDYDIPEVRKEIKGTLAVLEELREGIAELERGQSLELADEFIEFNDEARDALIDEIVKRVEPALEDGLANRLKFDYLISDIVDAIADSVDGFGR